MNLGYTADYAIDDNCRTWWQSSPYDTCPELIVNLKTSYDVAGIRILWAEPELNHNHGIQPTPVRYRVLYQPKGEKDWKVSFDCSANQADLLIDYRTFEIVRTSKLKLEIISGNKALDSGVLEFTVFGKPF